MRERDRGVLGGTGHRELLHPIEMVEAGVRRYLSEVRPTEVITGMAIGFDQLVADVCAQLGVPFIAAVPFEGQESIWPTHAKVRFYNLLLKAKEVVVVSPGRYEAWKMLQRNCWIVDHSNTLLAYMEPGTIAGGTFHCWNYAKTKNVPIVNLVDRL